MKTGKFIILAILATAFAASCQKDNSVLNDINSRTGKTHTIVATIDNDQIEVKSDYTISGSTASFHWTGTEVIGRLYYSNGYFAEDAYTSTIEATGVETSLAFSGYADGTSTDYAIYPKWTKEGEPGLGWRSNPFDLYLCPTLDYNSDSPLKGIVPMIGKLTDGAFVFKPVTAIISVTVKNLPESARSIELSSSARISGYYRLTSYPANYASNLDYVMNNGLTVVLAGNASTVADANKKIFKFSDGLDRGEHTFYFPVSVGTIPDLAVVVRDGDSNELQRVSYSKSITTERGKITRIPFTMDLAKATKVAVTGTSTQFYAHLTAMSPDAASVKFAVAATAASAIAAAETSTKVITAAGETNKVEVSDALTASGLYYLGYKVYDAAGAELISSSIPVYFLDNTGETAACQTYTAPTAAECTAAGSSKTPSYYYNSSALDEPDDYTLTIEASDAPTKGNIMATDFAGIPGKSYGLYASATFHVLLYINEPFANISGTDYYLREYYNNVGNGAGQDPKGTARFKLNGNYYGGVHNSIACWGGYFGLYPGDNTGVGGEALVYVAPFFAF